MLKKTSLRKIAVTTSALLVTLLIYLFPVKTNINIDEHTTYVEEDNLSVVYLLDKSNYVSEIKLALKSESLEEKLKEKLSLLIKGKENEDKIPKNFKQIIPENTKVLSLTINEDTVTVDFSKELLSISSFLEEKLISSIIYTLTSEEQIKKVVIKVEGEILSRLPYSHKLLDTPLDRSFGINNDYDINSLYNLTKTTIYYVGSDEDNTYYVPVTKVNNDNTEKITVIVNELKSSLLYQSNLSSYLSTDAELKKYEELEGVMSLYFNDKIFDSIYNENILEEVVYTIGMSVLENYDVSKVLFYVDDKEVLEFTIND